MGKILKRNTTDVHPPCSPPPPFNASAIKKYITSGINATLKRSGGGGGGRIYGKKLHNVYIT